MAQYITEGNQEQNLEIEADPEVMEECCLPASSDCLFIASRTTSPGAVLHIVRRALTHKSSITKMNHKFAHKPF